MHDLRKSWNLIEEVEAYDNTNILRCIFFITDVYDMTKYLLTRYTYLADIPLSICNFLLYTRQDWQWM